MNRTLVLAALLAAVPAFAQTSTIQAQSASTTQAQTQKEQVGSTGTSNSLGATGSGSVAATAGAKPVCTPSSLALTDCVSTPASGTSNPVVTNSLDATGTFSTTAPLVTPLDPSVDMRNADSLSASGTPKKP